MVLREKQFSGFRRECAVVYKDPASAKTIALRRNGLSALQAHVAVARYGVGGVEMGTPSTCAYEEKDEGRSSSAGVGGGLPATTPPPSPTTSYLDLRTPNDHALKVMLSFLAHDDDKARFAMTGRRARDVHALLVWGVVFTGDARASALVCLDLLRKCLVYSPGQRIDAKAALSHDWFTAKHGPPSPFGRLPDGNAKRRREGAEKDPIATQGESKDGGASNDITRVSHMRMFEADPQDRPPRTGVAQQHRRGCIALFRGRCNCGVDSGSVIPKPLDCDLARRHDPRYCVPYVEEYCEHIGELENVRRPPLPGFLEQFPEHPKGKGKGPRRGVTHKMRTILVDWLVELAQVRCRCE
jgi:hypothetical protein